MTDSEAQPGPDQIVLVVDDSKVIRKAVSTILGDFFQIVEAKNGEEAIAFSQKNPGIHAMLLDLWMPDVDGFEVLETLRSSTEKLLQNLPIIVVTGHEDDIEMRTRALSLGATEFIGKPFSAVELRNIVNQHVLPPSTTNIVPFKPDTTSIIAAPGTPQPSGFQPVVPSGRSSAAEDIRQARRSYLESEGENLLDEAVKTHRPISVLRLKVDRVKVLLRKTGTEFTKRTLYRIGKLIEGEIRRKDLVVRLGAADFAVVLPNTSNEEARAVSDAVFRMMRYAAFEYGELKFRLTVSGGLVTPSLGGDLEFAEINSLAEMRVDQAFTTGGDQLISDRLDAATIEEKVLNLDDAAELLKNGKTREVRDQLPQLLEKSMPLLLFANSTLDLNIDVSLKRLLADTHSAH